MVASVIHISDKFQLGDKTTKKPSLTETSSDWSEDVETDDGCPEVRTKGPVSHAFNYFCGVTSLGQVETTCVNHIMAAL